MHRRWARQSHMQRLATGSHPSIQHAKRCARIIYRPKSQNALRGFERFSQRDGGTIIHHMACCRPKGRYFGVNRKGRTNSCLGDVRDVIYNMSTATAQVGHWTRATRICTPYDTQVQHRIPKEQNRYPADAACSGIRVAHPDAPRAMPTQYLQTRCVHVHSKLCSRKLAIDLLGRARSFEYIKYAYLDLGPTICAQTAHLLERG
ncbi:hypothetical protein V8E52_010944 [Russula decolorans]|jgi:hypothetical protein